MLRVLLPLLAVGLAVYALVDLASSDEEERGGIPKGLWVVLIILLPFVGPLAWILVKRSQGRRDGARYGSRPGSPRPTGGPRRRRNAPVAPDDDPEFLWRLEQQQRRQARDETTADDEPTADQDAPEDAPHQDGDDDAPRPGATNGPDDGDDVTR